jgi:hypothetical protein
MHVDVPGPLLATRQKAMGRALRGVRSIEGIAAAVQVTVPVLDLAIDETADDDLVRVR